MGSENRIPIWVVEEEVGEGLPTQRTYHHSASGPPVGWVEMPEGMVAGYFADYVALWLDGADGRNRRIADPSTSRLVKAAIAGEHGLKWVPNETKES